MSRRIKWTYDAIFDYIKEIENRETGEKGLVVGFLEESGVPYECPTTFDKKVIGKVKKLDSSYRRPEWVRVTVEVNEKVDDVGRQFPTLIDIKPLKRIRSMDE